LRGNKVKYAVLNIPYYLIAFVFASNMSGAQTLADGLSKKNINDNEAIKSVLKYYDRQIYFTENKGQWPTHILYRADFPLGQALVTGQGMLVGTFDAASLKAQAEEGTRIEKEV